MYISRNRLYRDISNFSKIFIYGAGDYANRVYTLLKNTGLKERIGAFLVTNLKEQEAIDGISIKCIDELAALYGEGTVILIAVSKKYEGEIVEALRDFHGMHTIKLTDYMVQDDDFYEMLKEQPDEDFIGNVIWGCLWYNVESLCEFDKAVDDSIAKRNKKNIDKNLIVYISGDLKPRSKKIIGALIKKNYRVIVLEYGFFNELIRTEVITDNINFFHCKDITELFYRALQYQPLVYYFEPVWGDCIGSEIMIRHKGLFGKIAFASYDVLNDGYAHISEKNKLGERYCLENADGIVWRWFSKEFLEEKKGFVYKGKSIQFPDYCKGFKLEKKCKYDDTLKLCAIQGDIYELLNENVSDIDSIYTQPAKICEILNSIGNISGCIFHMFIGRCDDNSKEELEKLEKQYYNFKVFYGIKYNELIARISEYDYGCFFMTCGKTIPEQESIDHVYYGSTYINSISNRYLDYLDADIPIVGTHPRKQCEYLEKYGVIVQMNLSNLNIDYLKTNKEIYRRNVEQVKDELLIEHHIQRLIDWLHEL